MALSYSLFPPLSLSTALQGHYVQILAVACAVLAIVGLVFTIAFQASKDTSESPSAFRSFCMFFYASFLKPHTGDGELTGQQAALESFYKAQVIILIALRHFKLTMGLCQANVYDATRKRLLRGREDMLALVAAQLRFKAERDGYGPTKPVWVDVGSSKLCCKPRILVHFD